TRLYELQTIVMCSRGNDLRTVAMAGVERMRSPILSVRTSTIPLMARLAARDRAPRSILRRRGAARLADRSCSAADRLRYRRFAPENEQLRRFRASICAANAARDCRRSLDTCANADATARAARR